MLFLVKKEMDSIEEMEVDPDDPVKLVKPVKPVIASSIGSSGKSANQIEVSQVFTPSEVGHAYIIY